MQHVFFFLAPKSFPNTDAYPRRFRRRADSPRKDPFCKSTLCFRSGTDKSLWAASSLSTAQNSSTPMRRIPSQPTGQVSLASATWNLRIATILMCLAATSPFRSTAPWRPSTVRSIRATNWTSSAMRPRSWTDRHQPVPTAFRAWTLSPGPAIPSRIASARDPCT